MNRDTVYRSSSSSSSSNKLPISGFTQQRSLLQDSNNSLLNCVDSFGQFQSTKSTTSFDQNNNKKSSNFTGDSDPNRYFDNMGYVEDIKLNQESFALFADSEPVPTAPSYVEKYTSFTSSMFPRDILSALSKAINQQQQQQQVQHTINAGQYNIEGEVTRNNALANFRINIFLHHNQSEADYLIEFQRISGDRVTFHSFFADIKAAFSKMEQVFEDVGIIPDEQRQDKQSNNKQQQQSATPKWSFFSPPPFPVSLLSDDTAPSTPTSTSTSTLTSALSVDGDLESDTASNTA